MAIVQISRITHRKGLKENLPQLDGAELGWATDTRQLYIGNGTTEEGAPIVGNTEILTEFSDLLSFAAGYTYKGEAAGYEVQTGPTVNSPTVRSIQSKFDDFASVRDFGAVGDGTTDDTAAINRALRQLFCRELNPQIRRSLFFPAGIYKVSESILIPPYCVMWGEGADSSIIQMEGTSITDDNRYTARTTDNRQQTGNNIGSGDNAIPPIHIGIYNMSFTHQISGGTCFLLDQAQQVAIDSVIFSGIILETELNSSSADMRGVDFNSVSSIITSQINLNNCVFRNLNFGIRTSEVIEAVSVSQSKFEILSQGIVLGDTTAGPTGIKIYANTFDQIYGEGIIFSDVTLCASSMNAFYNVGNALNGVGSPLTPVIRIQRDNNVSITDLFQRPDSDAIVIPRINFSGLSSSGSVEIQLGRYNRVNGKTASLTGGGSGTVFSINSINVKAFRAFYTIVRGNNLRHGHLTVVSADADGSSLTLSYDDEYLENDASNIVLSVSQAGSTVNVNYSATAGLTAVMTYSIEHLA